MDALREYERKGGDEASEVPSVLLRSTGKSRFSLGSKRITDPVDDFMAMKRAELGLKNPDRNPNRDNDRRKRSTMGLNEFLRRFTSEDNASFQELHELD